MKTILDKITFIFIANLFTFSLFAQGGLLRGEVIAENNGEPLIGASIKIKGTTVGTITDYDGKFELKLSVLPSTILVTYVGFTEKEIAIQSVKERVLVKLAEDSKILDAVEVKGSRISEETKKSPIQVESLDGIAIKQTASANFYEGLGALKGVDMTTASLGFTIINTRGFNSTSPVRSLQIIDGVDNQAPGLNFSLGNFLGSSELDVNGVDLIVGASSAFYGPNAFNGVISMKTKDPFMQKGLAASVKVGERNLLDVALRYAESFKNKTGKDFFAYKINLSHMRANDWVADNYDPVGGTVTTKGNPGRYDAVNIYGDEYYPLNDASTNSPWSADAGLGIFYRSGYKEKDLVDYNTKNTKANASLHWRLLPDLAEQSPEVILSSNFGTGTTVYQGDNRFSLKDILFFQNRLELKKRDKYFIRIYATNEDAGKSYDPYFTALKLQELAKSDELFAKDYRRYWASTGNYFNKMKALGYPDLIYNDATGAFSYDKVGAAAWLASHNELLTTWHNEALAYANQKSTIPNAGGSDYLVPGTAAFQSAFDKITTSKSNKKENGTLFYDKSALYHAQGEYKFQPSFLEQWVVGGNVRLYRPNSDGTIFSDTSGRKIRNFEYGIYTGIEKKFLERKWTASATVRMDKNQNFDFVFTPAASLVWNPNKNDYFRVSLSSAVRNPTLNDQYLDFNVGRAILLGNLSGFKNLVTVESFLDYRNTLDLKKLKYFNVDPIQPEKVKTIEVGYRTTLFDRLYADMNYYYSFYDSFIGYNIGLDAQFSAVGLPNSIQVYRVAANSKNQVTTQGLSLGLNYYFPKYLALGGNYSWNKLNVNDKIANDPIIPAFNTPTNKYNITLSGRDIPLKIAGLTSMGFNINYKWVEGFVFQGSPQFSGAIPTYNLLDAQANTFIEKIHTTIKIGASNILNNMQFQTYGGPRIGRMAYVSFVYDFVKK